MLKRTFESREPKLWKDLYVSLLRPHLEYAGQAWNLYKFRLRGDLIELYYVKGRLSTR